MSILESLSDDERKQVNRNREGLNSFIVYFPEELEIEAITVYGETPKVGEEFSIRCYGARPGMPEDIFNIEPRWIVSKVKKGYS